MRTGCLNYCDSRPAASGCFLHKIFNLLTFAFKLYRRINLAFFYKNDDINRRFIRNANQRSYKFVIVFSVCVRVLNALEEAGYKPVTSKVMSLTE